MNARRTEKKVNAIVEEILNQENGCGAIQTETCPGGCEKLNDTPEEEAQNPRCRKFPSPQRCRCGVENSLRFSLRVMEAMRSLQRDVDQPSTSTAEEIADYIRSHYHHDGDLYAQVRTALRQVCSQGFVMELLGDEYYLIGPTKRDSCPSDCKCRTVDVSRRREGDDDQRNRVGNRTRLSGGGLRRNPRPPCEKCLGTAVVDLEDSNFHPIGGSADKRDNPDRRDGEFNADGIEDRNAEPIPGPSRRSLATPTPAGNAKKARVDDREVQCADETDDETEEDVVCTCDDEVVTRVEHRRTRLLDRPRVTVKNQRNGRRNDVEEDEEDEGERVRREAEEDEDTEGDSAYEELRARGPPGGRTATRERELKRWIRRCRQKCKRRRGRK